MGSESSGFEQAPGDVVAEVPESERGASEVFEATVDCLGRSVAGAGAFEEREDVRSALLQGPSESADLDQRGRNAAGDAVYHGVHHRSALDLVGFSVGGDDALVDAPGRFNLDVPVVREQRFESVTLLVGEEAVAGMQGAAGLVERIASTAAMPEALLLDALPASVEAVAGETDNMEWIHHGDGVREFFSGGGLEPAEAVHRDDLDPISPLFRTLREPLLEHGLRSALDHVQQPRRPRLVPVRGEVDDHGDVLVALAGVSPDVLVDTDRGDAIEPVRVIDQAPRALGEDRRVRGGPRHPEPCGDPRDGEVVQDEARQPPGESAAGDLRPLRRGLRRVLPPDAPAPGALVSADTDHQRRGPVSERFMREAAWHGVSRRSLAAALPTPPVRFKYAALQHRAPGRQMLPDSVKSELIEPAERGQIGRDESRLGHVEVFRMGSVRTSILRETSTPIRPATRSGDYTLVREEPT